MSNELRGSPGSAATAEPSQQPAAAAAPASSLPDTNFASTVAAASNPKALRDLMDTLKRTPAPSKPAAEATAPADEPKAGGPPASEPAAEPADPAPEGDTPPAEPSDPAPADPDAQPEPGTEPDPDADPAELGEVTPYKGDRPHLRLAKGDELGRLATAFKQRNKDWTLEQAMDAAKAKMGIKPVADPAAQPTAKPGPNADLPQTVDSVDTMIEQLEAAKTKATTEMAFEEADKIDRQLRRLDRHRSNLERQGERQQAEQAATYDRTFSESETRAAALYEFAGKPDSDGAKRMQEIEESLKELDDPLYYSPNKPLKIAQMVATELNIAPRKPGAKAPAPAKPAAPTAPKNPKQVLPVGGSRTAPAPAKPPEIDRFNGIKSLGDLRKVQASLGIRN